MKPYSFSLKGQVYKNRKTENTWLETFAEGDMNQQYPRSLENTRPD